MLMVGVRDSFPSRITGANADYVASDVATVQWGLRGCFLPRLIARVGVHLKFAGLDRTQQRAAADRLAYLVASLLASRSSARKPSSSVSILAATHSCSLFCPVALRGGGQLRQDANLVRVVDNAVPPRPAP